MRNHGLLLSTATLSLCAMFSAQAVAQDTTADEGGGLRDIVVTARRASESLQRSEEHTSELQSLMRTSYAVLRLKKKHNTSSQSEKQNSIICEPLSTPQTH